MIRRKNWITVARTQETDASSIGNNYGRARRARRAKRKGAKKLRQFLRRLLRLETNDT